MKTSIKNIIASLLAIALTSATINAKAEDKKADKKAEASAPAATNAPVASAKGLPYNGKLTAVDKTAQTITVKKKDAEKTFSITSATKITKAGKPATLEDGVVGDDVGIYFVEKDGKAEAKSLRFGPKPEKKGGKKDAKPAAAPAEAGATK